MRIAHLVIGATSPAASWSRCSSRARRGTAATTRASSRRARARSPSRPREGFDVQIVDVSRTFSIAGAVRLARLLRATDTDVLHTHTHSARTSWAGSPRAAGRTRRLAHAHREPLPAGPGRQAVHRPLDNATARSSARDRRRLGGHEARARRAGLPGRRIEVVHNGVELDGSLRGRRRREGQRELIEAPARVPDARAGARRRRTSSRAARTQDELERRRERSASRDRVVFAGLPRRRGAVLARALTCSRCRRGRRACRSSLLEAMARAARRRDAGRRDARGRRRRRDRPARPAARPRRARRRAAASCSTTPTCAGGWATPATSASPSASPPTR